jgi:hypothetical protein
LSDVAERRCGLGNKDPACASVVLNIHNNIHQPIHTTIAIIGFRQQPIDIRDRHHSPIRSLIQRLFK